MFSRDTISGYSDSQIAELNRRLEAATADLTGDEDMYYELIQAANERVLAAFDPPGA